MARNDLTAKIILEAQDKASAEIKKASKSIDELSATAKASGSNIDAAAASAESLASEMGGTADAAKGAADSIDNLDAFVAEMRAEFAKADDAIKEVQDSLSDTSEATDSSGAAFVKLAAKATVALAAISWAVKKMLESLENAGSEIDQRNLFASLTRDSGEALEAMTAASGGIVSQAKLIRSANEALISGIKQDDLPGLFAASGEAAVRLGTDVTTAFTTIVSAVQSGNAEALVQLGVVKNVVHAYEDYAFYIGESVDALTDEQKISAIVRASQLELADSTNKASDAFSAQSGTAKAAREALSSLGDAIGKISVGLVAMTAGGVVATVTGFSLLAEAIIKVIKGMSILGSYLPIVGGGFKNLASELQTLDDDIDGVQQKLAKLAFDLAKGGAELVTLSDGTDDLKNSLQGAVPAIDAAKKSLKTLGDEANDTEDDISGVNDEFDNLSDKARTRVVPALEATKEVLALMGFEFDRLVDSAGRYAAIQEALARGGYLSLKGTRLHFAGGGSRLTSEPGLTSFGTNTSQLSGGTFQFTGKTVTQSPDGRIEVR